MQDYENIFTIELDKRSGTPCIRGMRITVCDVALIAPIEILMVLIVTNQIF